MLVNVIPLTTNVQLAAIVFSIVFDDLDPVVTPSTWTTQLHNLRLDELEVPALVHVLDKSTGIICLLEEVTFDLSASTISCHFVDGSMEQWPLVGEQCINTLARVVQDVNESSFALEREMGERQREPRRFEAPLPPPAKASRHKKQRSLLRTLVASIIPLYSPSNSRLPSPPPTPISEKKPSPTISPRERRRQARSDLVDAFRLYILSELSKRFPRGGYTTWIIQSMLRRATETMEHVMSEAGGSNNSESGLQSDGTVFLSATPDSLPPTPSVCDDDGETILTDTDGSSLHTPTSLHAQFVSAPTRRHSYVSRSPRRLLSGSNYALYAHHAALVGRLRRLVMVDQDRQEQESEELKHHHRLLEIQSRRRAWLNQTLIGGVRSQHVDLGMSIVSRSSPLAQHSWSSEEYEYAPKEPVHSIQRRQAYEEYDKVRLRVKRSQRYMITPRLFPVSEEDGEDFEGTVLDAQELELDFEDFEVDLEAGTQWIDSPELSHNELSMVLPTSFEIEGPQMRPRVRTSSMHNHRLHVPPPAILRPGHTPSQLAASSILCQPLSSDGRVSNQDDHLPSTYTEVDVDLNVSQVGVSGYGDFDKCTEDEFTLTMDLPVGVRREARGILTNKRRLSFASDRSWFFSRSS